MIMNLRKQLKSQKGFTLVELMIVVVIIGVLAAIAIPKFTESAQSSRGSRIAADLRTIDSGIQQAIANGIDKPTTDDVKTYLAAGWPNPPKGQYKTAKVTTPTDAPTAYTITDNRATAGSNKVEDLEQ